MQNGAFGRRFDGRRLAPMEVVCDTSGTHDPERGQYRPLDPNQVWIRPVTLGSNGMLVICNRRRGVWNSKGPEMLYRRLYRR